jgi:hypothetical protein
VKVTTFMLYLLPAGWWALARLWAARKHDWKFELVWMAGAVALPFAATLGWLHFADATKQLNLQASFIVSANLRDFNFGTTATRWSSELWLQKYGIVRDALTWVPAVLLCAVLPGLTLSSGKIRWRAMAACAGWFVSVLVIFPVLYTEHEYYYAANTMLLLIAMGLALVALAESRMSGWVAALALTVVLGGQVWRYVMHYYPAQSAISPGGDGLSNSLRTLTNPGDVIVVLGQDWNSMLPYYAQRRALMLRDNIARDPVAVESALARLEGEKIGAVIIVGEANGREWLIDRAAVRGIARAPLYQWLDASVHVPEARRAELLTGLLENDFHQVRLAPGVELPQAALAGKWYDMAAVHRWQRKPFVGFQPQPVRFFASFGPTMDGSSGQAMYGAHPVTRLVFTLSAGTHTLRSSLQMPLDAYRADLLDSETTDGVEVSLHQVAPVNRALAGRYFNPRRNPEDRGTLRPLEFTFTLEQAGEVELFFGPGPAGKDTRDWIQLGPLKFE